MNALRDLKLSGSAALFIWSGLLGSFLYYDVNIARQHTEELALKEARANFNSNMALRFWIVRHGDVYVPVDEKNPPNPTLKQIPERDVETPSGKKLTLMNSSYVLQQLMDEFGESHGVRGKLTSLKPLNPDNIPDAWESQALHQFESGREEVYEFTKISGKPYLRLMSVMLVQEDCIKCHGAQGYQVGDVRGGASILVPMRPYLHNLNASIRQKLLIYLTIWLIGLLGIGSWILLTRQRLREKAATEARLQLQHEAIERANTELTHFANISAHHLMEPTRRLLSFSQRLHSRLDKQILDEDARLALQYIEQGATRLRDLVRDIERYLTAGVARGTLQATAPRTALNEVQRRLSKLIDAQQARIDLPPLAPLYLDLPRLTDIFEVLLSNALIHAGTDKPLHIHISSETLASAVRVRVEDNGPGIDAEYRERVFGVFEQLQPNPLAGTGIGLAIARRIVESRNGKIWIEASTYGGTAVVFDLPIGEDQA